MSRNKPSFYWFSSWWLGVNPVDYPHNKLPSEDYFHTTSGHFKRQGYTMLNSFSEWADCWQSYWWGDITWQFRRSITSVEYSFSVLGKCIWCLCQALQLKVSKIGSFALLLLSTVAFSATSYNIWVRRLFISVMAALQQPGFHLNFCWISHSIITEILT